MVTKASILQDIQRTATDNVALGGSRFASETGIKRSDWYPIYWVRWSDAVREAGCVPREFTRRHETTKFLQMYAQLARELGRLPIQGELERRHHIDSTFPSMAVFRRLGGKAKLIAQLLEYCQKHVGYEDVKRLCEEYVPRDQAESHGPEHHKEEELGFVYLIKSGRFYKIGRSNAAGRREYELAIQLPERAITIHVIRTDDPSGIEEYWHTRFTAKRKGGEWFNLDAADVAVFKRRKFM